MTALKRESGDWRTVYGEIVSDLTAALAETGGKAGGETRHKHWLLVAWKDGSRLVMFPMLGRSEVWGVNVDLYDTFRELLPELPHVVALFTDRTRGFIVDQEQLDRERAAWRRTAGGKRYQLLPRDFRGATSFSTAAECASKLAELGRRAQTR